MARPNRSSRRHGFAIVELGTLIVVGIAVVAMLLLASDRTRRQGRLGHDIANLRAFGAATGAYAADNKDLYWAFSWKKGGAFCQYPDLNNADSDYQAHANQAVYLFWTRAGRQDISRITSWFADLKYSHLVLAEYLDSPLPNMQAVSPADKQLLLWARDPPGFDQCQYQPAPTGCGSNSAKRWPYSSSYQLDTAFYDTSPVGMRIGQGPSHWQYSVPSSSQLGTALVSHTTFPSQKVLLHDQTAHHFPPRASFFGYAESRQPLLFVDGGVFVRATDDANPGWKPNNPTSPTPSIFMYQPQPWEPAALGAPTEQLVGRYRWTRGGIEGRDFGGPEVCTGQPGCK